MRISYWLRNSDSWADTATEARAAVAAGCSGLWVADHFMPNGDGPTGGDFHEAFALLAALAVEVPGVRIGTMVAGNTYRHPAVLAKQAVTIDHVSGGDRFVLGIGAGWQRNEHEAYGLPFESFRWRFDRLAESLEVIRSLFAEERTTFVGEHIQLHDAPLEPKPLGGGIPILIGGKGPNRTLPLVARYADAWNMWGTPEMMAESGAVLDRRCDEVGRDRASVHRTAAALAYVSRDEARLNALRDVDLGRPTLVGTPAQITDQLAAYVRAGVAELVVPAHGYSTPTERDEVLGLLFEALADLS